MVLFQSLFSGPLPLWLQKQLSQHPHIQSLLEWLNLDMTNDTNTSSDNDNNPLLPPLLLSLGTRECDTFLILQEVVMGVVVTLPLALLLAQLLLRFHSWLQLPLLRRDVQHALLHVIVADALLDVLLPSCLCVPTQGMFFNAHSTSATKLPLELWSWLQTMWGRECYIQSTHDKLTPTALLIAMGLRAAFLVVGLHLGSTFWPIAVTGGIATGKSTVVQLLETQDNATKQQELIATLRQKASKTKQESSNKETKETNESNTTNEDKKNENKETETKEDDNTDEPPSETTSDNDNATNDNNAEHVEDPYTCYVIDCDRIGHEILLHPAVLHQGQTNGTYTIKPGESVFFKVSRQFAAFDIWTDGGKQAICRKKLGRVIFQDAKQRRKLNSITHPRIAWIVFKRCLYGCWASGADFCIVEVPLLFESRSLFFRLLFGRNVLVTLPTETKDQSSQRQVQLARLRERCPDWTEKECEQRIDAQMPLAEKEKRADDVLVNSDNVDVLLHNLQRLQQDWSDRLYGVGVSAAQVVGLVVVTLAAGLAYQFHRQQQQQAMMEADGE